ncbi:hypothetical protein OSTOST_18115 [Ostertagia ostertagi]
MEQAHIAVRHRGPCGEGLCASFTCKSPLTCVVVNEKPSCVCPQCTDELREKISALRCVLVTVVRTRMSAKCVKQPATAVRRSSSSTTEFVKDARRRTCQYYSTCIVENGKAECRCPTECNKNASSTGSTPVCGTDGVTYSSGVPSKEERLSADEIHSGCLRRKMLYEVIRNCYFYLSHWGRDSHVFLLLMRVFLDACIHIECGFGEECRGGKCVCPAPPCPHPPPVLPCLWRRRCICTLRDLS